KCVAFKPYLSAPRQTSDQPPAPKLSRHRHTTFSKRQARISTVTTYVEVPASPRKASSSRLVEDELWNIPAQAPIFDDIADNGIDPAYLNYVEDVELEASTATRRHPNSVSQNPFILITSVSHQFLKDHPLLVWLSER